MDGQIVDMKDYEPGVTVPPFHVFCRSVTVPYFEDNFTGERAARDEDGNTYYVPDSMTYKDWKSEFVSDEVDVKRLKEKIKNKVDVLTKDRPPKTLSDIILENQSIQSAIVNAPEPFKTVLMSKSQDIKFAKTNCIGQQRYNSKHGIFIDFDRDSVDKRGQWSTLFHEIGHNIDVMSGISSNNQPFVNLLKNDFADFTNAYCMKYNTSMDETYRDITNWLESISDEESHIMSDLFDALSNGKCRGYYTHCKGYWKSDSVIASEAFAHFFSASSLDNKVKLDDIKQVFPNAYNEFLKLVGEIK